MYAHVVMAAAVLAITVATAGPAHAVNFSVGQNADMLLGADSYTEAAFGPDVQTQSSWGMAEPVAVDVDSSGSLYVVDKDMNRVQRWDTTPGNTTPSTDVIFKPTVANGSTPDIHWSWAYGAIDKGMKGMRSIAVAGDGATAHHRRRRQLRQPRDHPHEERGLDHRR
ncbi:MAG: hypothetical protein JWN72_1276 [Thermoleophilia bacterium]|nr:hypothetical protein [Thermoleophilia bacterium]